MSPDTIKQRSKSVSISTATGERTIAVHRLQWKKAKEFYAELARTVAKLFKARAADPSLLTSPSALAFIDQLPALVTDSDKLVALLLTGAADLDPAQQDELDWGDVLALVDAALEVNLDAEIKNSCAGVMGKIKGFVAGNPKTSSGAASTPTSSTPATPPTT